MSNIPKGYKQTVIGVIPEDWELKKLRDVADFSSGTTPSRDMFERYFQNGTISWVKTMDLTDGEINQTNEKVTEIALKEVSSLKVFPPETVLVAMYGGFNQIGRTGLLMINACVNQALTAVHTDKTKLRAKFLINYLNYRVNYWKDVASSSRKDPNITSNDIKDFPIPLPDLDEQITITTILNDANTLIVQLEKLIAKKRNIKQGAMQELLRSKERWKMKKLGEVGGCIRGVSYNGDRDLHSQDKDMTVRLLRSNNVQQNNIILNDLQFVNKLRVNDTQYLFENDILICMANGSKQLVGKAAFFKANDQYKYTFGAFMGCFRISSLEADSCYIYYNFLSNNYRNFIDVLLSGSSINNLKPSDITSIVIPFPTILEQKKISLILSDMDAEIELLEKKLEKYKMIKEGMMQNLLTGKIRLL